MEEIMDIRVQKFINEIKLLISEVEANSPKKESLEWYLINNIKNYLCSIYEAQSIQDIKKATKIFSRFCVESMDWNTELFKRCSNLIDMGSKITSNQKILIDH